MTISSTMTGSLSIALVLLGLTVQARSAAASARSTPSETWAAIQVEYTARDYRKVYTSYSPGTRERLLALSAFLIHMLTAEGFFKPADLRDLNRTLRDHSVPETNDARWQIYQDSLSAGGEANRYRSPLDEAKDKEGCFATVQGWLATHGLGSELPAFLRGSLEDVVVQGDSATARVAPPEGMYQDEAERVRFERIEGLWYLVFELR